jgi:hypothetical protein
MTDKTIILVLARFARRLTMLQEVRMRCLVMSYIVPSESFACGLYWRYGQKTKDNELK